MQLAQTMTNSVDPAAVKSTLLRHRVDWLLALSLLAALPLVAVFCIDLWFRSDLRFFPLMVVFPIGLAVWRAWRPNVDSHDSSLKRSGQTHTLHQVSLGLWTAGGVSTLSAPFLFSPWLALLGLILGWTAWLLTRFDRTPWPRLLKWTLPPLVLLILPLGERSNLVPAFSSNATYAASSLLDLLGVDHLPSQQTLQLSAGRYDVASVCRGLGNPYLMFSLVVLMCICTHCSLSAGLLTSATAPLWSWGGTILLVVSSVWLAEQRDVYIWAGKGLWLAQSIALIGGLLSALLFKWSLQTLMAPFVAHSAGVGGIHKFFNRVALWPQADPLRTRRPSVRSQPPAADTIGDNRPWLVRRSGYILGIVACLLIVGGTASVLRLMGTGSAGWPRASELMSHARFSGLANKSPLSPATLPEELLGMHLINFEQFATPGTTTGKPKTSRWTYINELQTVTIQCDAPYRGAIAIERQRVLDGSRVVERQPTIELEAAGQEPHTAADASTFRVEALTLDDPIMGRSYVTYTHLPIDGSPPEAFSTGGESMLSGLRSAVAYRPSSACVSLWLESSISQTKDEQAELQQMLVRAAELFRRAE